MIKSINPYNGKEIATFEELSNEAIDKKLSDASDSFSEWRKTSFAERSGLMKKAAEELRKNKHEYAETMTAEMGKPITQSLAEVEKCAWVCDYYSKNAEQQLANEEIETDASQSYITYEPMGIILAVMPWNYPFWQVFRFAAPALMAGNVAVLKHASNVMCSANNIEKIFERSGFPSAVFQNLVIGSKKVEKVIRDKRVKAVTLTGSTAAGSAVASTAGEEIKKSVLELGGSNALVVFEDANLEKAVDVCVQARFQNNGQSCIAGKRLLLHKKIAKEFLDQLTEKVAALKKGDPMDKDTFISVQAREDLAVDVEKQIETSVKEGAKIILGGKRKGAYMEPTILSNVTPGMTVFEEEIFGPAMGTVTFETEKEAVDLVNSSIFGLGVSVFTEDMQRAKNLIPLFDDGAVFINELVKSDPRLPFGGTKESGYGRELSYLGIREFVNIKTVYFK